VNTLAQKLVREVVLRDPQLFTPEAMNAAQSRVLDTIGVALAGMRTPLGSAMSRFALEWGKCLPEDGVLLWGTGSRVAADKAVLANGTAAHALDYDDTNTHAILHAGAAVVPLALALAQRNGASGAQMLEAIICGYQVAAFLGKQLAGTFPRAGFSGSAICDSFGAVAVAARLGGLDEAASVSAFGITGSLASGINEYLLGGGDTKPVHLGWAAQSGLQAARMAKAGVGGPASVLEGGYGVFKSFARSALPANVLDQDIWSEVEILQVSPKPYPVCHGIHATADAWLELMQELRAAGVDPFTGVKSVTCLIHKVSAGFSMEPLSIKRRPSTPHQARFSFPWCLARLAVDGQLKLASFAQNLVVDPALHAFMDKVDYEVIDYEGYPRRVPGGLRVVSEDGRIFEKRKDEQRGGPTNPFTQSQLEEKFFDTAAGSGSVDQLSSVISHSKELKTASKVDALVRALTDLRLSN